MAHILFSVPVQQSDLNAIIETFPNSIFHIHPNNNLEDLVILEECEVIATFGHDLNVEIIKRMPKLKLVQVFKAGVDTLPLKELHEKKVLVSNVRGIHRISVSELVFGCILALSQNLFTYRQNQQAHKWNRIIFKEEIFQKTIGIIGAGSIGQDIAKKAKAFGMYTLGLNTSGKPLAWFDQVYPPDGLGELLSASDYVLVSLPLTSKTYHFINEKHFTLMKPTSCFINIARGQVVNEQALVDALKNKLIKNAILDVFDQEPLPPDSPLWEMENVIITPHIGGVSPRYMERALEIFKHNLSVYLNQGNNFINLIDPARGY
ncbi:D-2-hydroxyacid dehydrogenase [Desulfallas sp. Bu1-1]|uniref:D-2-hydroxyacid dehydrogenase n=1 Tax=Desulfallas sp. Bu1-1 TaxID=2787620 RepID=UPI00189E056C|nr:D-2-hydroxyacid dehydrogenase [Desulfallas sp. Bu1-1]MBF7083662.1 D-2-hydroxyacid dehydrogenase [Desulfallas sp. Bu1-1]